MKHDDHKGGADISWIDAAAPPHPAPEGVTSSHGRTKPATTWWIRLSSLVGGMSVILLILLGIQVTWIYYGSGIDQDTVVRTLEQATTKKISRTEKDNVATLRTTDPPIESTPVEGELFAYLHIPRFGESWTKPIQEGTDAVVLDNLGVGHYIGTAMPGEKGNASFAGHATVNDFGVLDQLEAGDEIIVEGTDNWYVYKMTESSVVDRSDTSVVQPDAAGVERGITLTTCYPMFTTTDQGLRYIVHGRFVGWAPKSEGVPESLAKSRKTFIDKVNRTVSDVSETVNMPVSGLLGLSCLTAWLVLDAFLWVCCHRSVIDSWREKGGTWNPMAWIWRIQAAPMCSERRPVRAISAAIRLLLELLLWAGITFVCWRWVCPWLAETIPALSNPHPTV